MAIRVSEIERVDCDVLMWMGMARSGFTLGRRGVELAREGRGKGRVKGKV